MKVGIVGSGYVGTTTGAILAEIGHEVIAVDIDSTKVSRLNQGDVPIHEPGLNEIVKRNLDRQRIRYTTDYAALVGSRVVFLCLGTPTGEDGLTNMSQVLAAAGDYAKVAEGHTILVNKSTVPVGSASRVSKHVQEYLSGDAEISVVSNPEFLREGMAVDDCMNPDRIVIGASNDFAFETMRKLYNSYRQAGVPYLEISPESAEHAKLAANAFLATKISFANEVASAAVALGADGTQVLKAIGLDSRIGSQFLRPGPGWGGSCFPKDTHAAVKAARDAGTPLLVVEAAIESNERQKALIVDKIINEHGGDIEGKTFALWGLAFKADTDDTRVSPAIEIAERLLAAGAMVTAYDPQALENAKKHPQFIENPNIQFLTDAYEATSGADALVIATEWAEFGEANFGKLKNSLNKPIIFDCRNMFDTASMRGSGFVYHSIGRQTVHD